MIPEQADTQLALFEIPAFSQDSARSCRPTAPRARRSVLDSPEVKQWLELPLFTLEGVPAPEALVEVERIDEDEVAAVDAVMVREQAIAERESERQPWTTEGVLHLHSVLLTESLKTLASRGNANGKLEILDWIFEPEYLGTTERNGREIQVYAKGVPFSFSFCCRLECMNPERIQDLLLAMMPEALKSRYQ